MKIARISLFLVASTSIFALLTASSCKKSNNSSSNAVISATVSGTGITPTSYLTSIYYTSENWWDIGGLNIKSGDSTGLEILVPSSVTVNKPFLTDTTSASIDYYPNGPLSGKNYNASYSWGHGTMTVTSLDTVNHKIAGTFSGILHNFQNVNDSVIVTNGEFNTPYTIQ